MLSFSIDAKTKKESVATSALKEIMVSAMVFSSNYMFIGCYNGGFSQYKSKGFKREHFYGFPFDKKPIDKLSLSGDEMNVFVVSGSRIKQFCTEKHIQLFDIECTEDRPDGMITDIIQSHEFSLFITIDDQLVIKKWEAINV